MGKKKERVVVWFCYESYSGEIRVKGFAAVKNPATYWIDGKYGSLLATGQRHRIPHDEASLSREEAIGKMLQAQRRKLTGLEMKAADMQSRIELTLTLLGEGGDDER